MASFSDHHAADIAKILLVGDSGSGKTGTIAALLNENVVERVFIQDWDNGLDILHGYLDPDKRDRIIFETLTDKMKPISNGPPIPMIAKNDPNAAYARGMRLLDNWVSDGKSYGSIMSWEANTLFVCDSLTMMGVACLHYVKAANEALLESDWGFYGPAMEMQEKTLELLFSNSVKCNVLMTAHIAHIAPKKQIEVTNSRGEVKIQSVDAGDAKAYPSALGNKLPPKVGRYFNAVLRCRTRGQLHVIETTSDEEIELKNPSPLIIPREIQLNGGKGGLATYFTLARKAARGEGNK